MDNIMSSAKKYKLSPSMSYSRQSNTVPIMIGLFVFIIIIGSTITSVIIMNKAMDRTSNICTNICKNANVLTPNNIPACIAQCTI